MKKTNNLPEEEIIAWASIYLYCLKCVDPKGRLGDQEKGFFVNACKAHACHLFNLRHGPNDLKGALQARDVILKKLEEGKLKIKK